MDFLEVLIVCKGKQRLPRAARCLCGLSAAMLLQEFFQLENLAVEPPAFGERHARRCGPEYGLLLAHTFACPVRHPHENARVERFVRIAVNSSGPPS